MTYEDFRGWLMQKSAQGWPEELLLRMCVSAIMRHEDAAARWVDLEISEPGPTTPLWVNAKEAGMIADSLKGLKGAQARRLRHAARGIAEELIRG